MEKSLGLVGAEKTLRDIAPGSMGEHHWHHRYRDVAHGEPLDLGNCPDLDLGNFAIQPIDLRHQRHLRSGNRQHKRPQGRL